MSVGLPDVNVLIALAWPSHVHHKHARRWFDAHSSAGWASCPFTQSGFIRISSNPRVIAEAVSPREAISLLRKLVCLGNHTFWPDDLDLTTDPDTPTGLLMGHRQVTDAYLLGLAIRNGGRLVTLDQTVVDLLPRGSAHLSAVETITLT